MWLRKGSQVWTDPSSPMFEPLRRPVRVATPACQVACPPPLGGPWQPSHSVFWTGRGAGTFLLTDQFWTTGASISVLARTRPHLSYPYFHGLGVRRGILKSASGPGSVQGPDCQPDVVCSPKSSLSWLSPPASLFLRHCLSGVCGGQSMCVYVCMCV